MSFSNDDLNFLNSFQDEEVFAAVAKGFLDEVEKDNPRIAADLREIVALILQRQKTYNIVTADKKKIIFDAYEAAYDDWRKGEAALVEASEHLYEEYKDAPDEMRILAESYAKLVSLLPATKNVARENLLDIFRKRQKEALKRGSLGPNDHVPGDVRNYLIPNPDPNRVWDENLFPRTFTFKRINDYINDANEGRLKLNVTAHPTNVINEQYLQLILKLSATSREITENKGKPSKQYKRFKHVLADLKSTPMTPTIGGLPKSFSPAEETDMEIRAFKDIYHNMPLPRRTIDKALNDRAALRKNVIRDKYTAKKRLALHLKVEPMSWVMGDKDGNPNVKAEHLLRSLIARQKALMPLYRDDIEQLKEAGITLPKAPDGSSWKQVFSRAENTLAKAFAKIEEVRLEEAKKSTDIPLSQENFDDLMQMSSGAFGPLGAIKMADCFIADLEAAFRECSKRQGSEKQQQLLIDLIDRARNFRLNFGAIGLRETSSEYTEVLEFLFMNKFRNSKPFHYASLSEEEKIAFLENVSPSELGQRIRAFLSSVKESEVREYSPENPKALAYHTLKRLELAAYHPDGVREMVLAEFKHSSNILEGLKLQEGIAHKTGRPLNMAVIPLFEEFGTLENANKMLWRALKTKPYRQHLLALAKGDPSKIELFIQIAHSDNNRRSGAPAARVAIYDVHHRVPHFLQQQYKRTKSFFEKDEMDKPDVTDRISMSNLVLTPVFFEGRSQTDSTRGGQRAQTSLANLYNQHEYTWETFQGIDVFTYLQFPEAYDRMVTRNKSHNPTRRRIMLETRQPEALRRIPDIESAVIKAFKRTGGDYVTTHFNMAGYLFGYPLVNGRLNGVLYNRGCRSNSRGEAQSDQDVCKALQNKADAREKPMSADDMRAIAFGNNFMDAGIHPAILGTLNIEKYLAEAFVKDSDAREELKFEAKEFGYLGPMINDGGQVILARPIGSDGHLTPTGLKTLFNVSPGFRDEIHFISMGVSATALEHTLRRFSIPSANLKLKDYVYKTAPLELAAAAKLVLGSQGFEVPKDIENIKDMQNRMASGKLDPHQYLEQCADQCARLSFLVRTVTGMAPESTLNSGLGAFPQVLRDCIIKEASSPLRGGAFTDDDFKTLNHLATAILSARHGRIFASDDPHTGVATRELRETEEKKYGGFLQSRNFLPYLKGQEASPTLTP